MDVGTGRFLRRIAVVAAASLLTSVLFLGLSSQGPGPIKLHLTPCILVVLM